MPDFLHGVETISTTVGPRKIEEIRTAVVHLTGTAPTHHSASPPAVNDMTIVRGEEDLAQFGPDIDGYTIPAALKAFVEAGAGTVLVTNVFDPATHKKAAVAPAAKAITAGKIAIGATDLISVTVTTSDDAPCVAGTDYTVDKVTGTITVVAGGLLDGDATAKVGYTEADPSAVDGADVIGATDVNGVRSGMQVALGAMARFGFGPKILIAPTFSAQRSVASAMAVLAQKTKLRAIPLFDVPVATPKDDAIAGRGPAGDPDLGITDNRAVYCFPHLKVSATKLVPYSSYVAAMIAQTDRDLGYWHSPSNKKLPATIVGTEFALSAAVNDPNSDVNALNAVGILTVFSAFGTGLRTWGNRTAAFPGDTSIETFIPVIRTRDVLEESIELFTLNHLDGPITDVLVQNVLADTNEFVRTLVGRGALMPGSAVTFDPAKNPASELATGRIRWTITFCPPPPAERITYDSVLDTNLLKLG